ncbi:MAG: UDP-N-acetylmuramate dehydrogenase [bacterium]|nr:UDP-N-acetylmuramate dehydrogenase [bacterium]
MGNTLLEEARRLFGKNIALAEPLSKHCSFGIGGPADLFLSAADIRLLREGLAFCREWSLPYFVLGRGTNVLVPDAGVRGMVICVRAGSVQFDRNRVVAQAGASLQKLARMVAERGLAGMEFAVGIPGSVGGAAIMNAGAHGGWIGEPIEEVRLVETSGGGEVRLGKSDLRFGYRESNLRRFPGIISEVILVLHEDEPQAIKERMDQFLLLRKLSQPIRCRSAGSVFKNVEGQAAGRLIDLAGCKGMRRGGAVVSHKHANFIITSGGATYSDVKALIEDVREKVRAAHGVELELEIIDLGDWA